MQSSPQRPAGYLLQAGVGRQRIPSFSAYYYYYLVLSASTTADDALCLCPIAATDHTRGRGPKTKACMFSRSNGVKLNKRCVRMHALLYGLV